LRNRHEEGRRHWRGLFGSWSNDLCDKLDEQAASFEGSGSMAKITANGATEVARIRTTFAESTYLWVMTSDGRILRRCTDFDETYQVIGRGWKGDKTLAALEKIARSAGHVPL
jgi:hypothetical protein